MITTKETWNKLGIEISDGQTNVKMFKRYIPAIAKSLREGCDLDAATKIFNKIIRFKTKVRIRDDVGGSLTIPIKIIPVFATAIEIWYNGEK